jgi:hypothetical protein
LVNFPVLKAFVFDLLTTVVTGAAIYLTVPENVEAMGFSDTLVPIIVGVAGAAVIAVRRYLIESK